MRRFLAWVCVLAWAAVAINGYAAATKKKSTTKSGSSKSAAKKQTASKGASTKSASSKSGTSKSSGKKSASLKRGAKKGAPRTTWRNRQLTPSPERYREIQSALAAKGYLNAEEATGVWGSGSTEALRRFQGDQNIPANGKINSLSLIALGLGPKRESPQQGSEAVPPKTDR